MLTENLTPKITDTLGLGFRILRYYLYGADAQMKKNKGKIHSDIIYKMEITFIVAAIVGIIIFCCIYERQNKKYPSVAEIRITSEAMNRRLLWEDGYVEALIRIEAEGFDDIVDKCEVKVRGNSTLEADKLSYAFRFDDNAAVLGMGKGKKWVLLANAYDPTLMRNYIALYTASKLRLNYTSEYRYADLWINDTYQGNYLLTEPVQDGGDRVDIHPAAGDFLIEYEKTRIDEDETSYIVTDDGYRYLIHDPKHASEKQAEYVLEIMNHVEEVISEIKLGDIEAESTASMTIKSKTTESEAAGSEATGSEAARSKATGSEAARLEAAESKAAAEKLSNVIDVDSFVDYCVFAELMKSVDMGFSSEFYYYKDGILYAGPVWDYDMSAGNVNSSYYTHYSNLATTGDSAQGFWIEEQGKLLKELMDCPQFEKLVWDRYHEKDVQDIITHIYSDGGLIDELANVYGDAFSRNYNEAGWEEGKSYFAYAGSPLPTFDENVDYLKKWFMRRNEWLLENSLSR